MADAMQRVPSFSPGCMTMRRGAQQ